MARHPTCSSCGCHMQLVAGGWRCPWTSSARHEAGTVDVDGPLGKLSATRAPATVCGWPSGSREATTTHMLR